MTIKVQQTKTLEEWELQIGEEIKELRLRQNLERQTLCQRAGISLGALRNIEGGKGASLKTLILVVRALERENWLLSLLPPTPTDPFVVLRDKRMTKGRSRASGARLKRTDVTGRPQ